MRYLCSGSGHSLVLLHGLLGYSFSWRYAIPVLAQQATVYSIDMLGAGFSDRPPAIDYSLKANAQRLLRFFDLAGIETCNLLGTSYGGAVAMAASAMAPERIRSLILPAPVNPWSSRSDLLPKYLSSWPVAQILQFAGPHFRFIHAYVLRRLFGDPRRIRPGTLAGYSAPFTLRHPFTSQLGILRSWNSDLQQLQRMLPRIAKIPALLIWGDLDAAVNPESSKKLETQFKYCQSVILKGVGHLPYEEVPEEFSRVIGQFLADRELAHL